MKGKCSSHLCCSVTHVHLVLSLRKYFLKMVIQHGEKGINLCTAVFCCVTDEDSRKLFYNVFLVVVYDHWEDSAAFTAKEIALHLMGL